ncbi:hypothetical protein [Solibacillus cecembensis]|uniref:hypothetical protein n=1 Tax=Solibacillus cecembensis TaxID=459347 RepID=UPI003D08C6FD
MDADFLIPVGCPNGMIQVYKGKVKDTNDKRRTFFEDFLKLQPEKTIKTKYKTDNDSQNNKSYLLLYVIASILVGKAVIFLLYRYKRKK